MKALNIILSIILTLLLAFAVWFFVGGTLKAEPTIATADAMDHIDVCRSIQSIMNANAAPQKFAELPGSPEGCTLVDTTVTLTNPGLFDAEWLDISVSPAPGDICVYSLTGEAASIPAQSASHVNLKLLTTAPAGTPRTITISYYIYGMLRSVTVEG